MYANKIRALVALLIALSASVGVQHSVNPSQLHAPAVLDFTVQSDKTLETVPTVAVSESAKIAIMAEPSAVPAATSAAELAQKEKERRVAVLQNYLSKHNSPMADNAQDFIDAAEQYELDWKLVPAIAGVESTFGKRILPGSYNPFGWGGGYIKFESFRDSIYTVSKGVSEKYVKDGLDTPHKMQKRYAPPSHTWGNKVQYFMDKIEASSQDNTENTN